MSEENNDDNFISFDWWVYMLVIIIGSVSFGIWQSNVYAGVFAFVLLFCMVF